MTNPIVSGFAAAGRFFKFVGVKIAHGFVAIFGSDQAEAFAHAVVDLLKTELGQIALSVVAALMTVNASNAEKRDQAFKNIVTQAEASGLRIETSVVNLLIELAVTALKQKFIEPEGVPPAA